MKKKLTAFLLVSVMVLLPVIPVAANVYVTEPVQATAEQGISPHTEMTRIYWRTYHGVLQWRVWSITNGRWMTDWTNANFL